MINANNLTLSGVVLSKPRINTAGHCLIELGITSEYSYGDEYTERSPRYPCDVIIYKQNEKRWANGKFLPVGSMIIIHGRLDVILKHKDMCKQPEYQTLIAVKQIIMKKMLTREEFDTISTKIEIGISENRAYQKNQEIISHKDDEIKRFGYQRSHRPEVIDKKLVGVKSVIDRILSKR